MGHQRAGIIKMRPCLSPGGLSFPLAPLVAALPHFNYPWQRVMEETRSLESEYSLRGTFYEFEFLEHISFLINDINNDFQIN